MVRGGWGWPFVLLSVVGGWSGLEQEGKENEKNCTTWIVSHFQKYNTSSARLVSFGYASIMLTTR